MKGLIVILFMLAGMALRATEPITSAVDSLLKEAFSINAFSGNVLIAKNGSVIYRNSVGFSDWEKKTPLNDSTLFNIGSIGKDFTQVVMIQLWKEGRFEFDDPLSKYMKLFDDARDQMITLRMLLTMQSGLGDYHEAAFRDLSGRLEYIRKQPLLFEPGTGQEYSNSGYVVLAAVIEAVTGKSYEQNVKERIFMPLKMMHSEFVYPGSTVENRAAGTEIKPNGKKITEHEVNDVLTPSGDGGAYSCTDDLLKFYHSLLEDGQMLTDGGKEVFFSRFNTEEALSISEIKKNPNAMAGFAGGLNGWNSCVDLLFGRGYIIISLSNLSDTDRPAEEMNFRINQIIRTGKYEHPKEPRFVFAFRQWRELGTERFVEEIDGKLKENGYETIQGPYFFNQIAITLWEENNFPDSYLMLKKNTALYPHDSVAWQRLGTTCEKLGKEEEAQAAFFKCLDEDPENQEARKHLDKK